MDYETGKNLESLVERVDKIEKWVYHIANKLGLIQPDGKEVPIKTQQQKQQEQQETNNEEETEEDGWSEPKQQSSSKEMELIKLRRQVEKMRSELEQSKIKKEVGTPPPPEKFIINKTIKTRGFFKKKEVPKPQDDVDIEFADDIDEG
jgi:FtsZ-interacting cell division protein ZipA